MTGEGLTKSARTAIGDDMGLNAEPWARVRTPVPIPDRYTTGDLADLDGPVFAEMVRSNLVPRDQSPAGRRAWEGFWRELADDPPLADRTYTVLEDFLDTTESALESGRLEPDVAQRAEKFRMQCEHAWNRIDRDRSRHLAWAGRAGDFQPAAQRVTATLVGAIARHRSTVTRSGAGPSRPDRRLWDALRQVNLDPDDYR